MQLAKLEANEAFKNIKLGVDTNRVLKRKHSNEKSAGERVPKARKLTRLEQAKLDANKAFHGLPLHKLPLKRPAGKVNQKSGKENTIEKRDKKTVPVAKAIQNSIKKVVDKQQACMKRTPVGLSGNSVQVIDTKDVAVEISPVRTTSVATVEDSDTAVTPSTELVTCKPITFECGNFMSDSNTPATVSTLSKNSKFDCGNVLDSNTVFTASTKTPAASMSSAITPGTANSQAVITPQIHKNFSNRIAPLKEHGTAFENTTENATAAETFEKFEKVVVATRASAETFPMPQRLTRLQRARLEALQSFGGQGLDDLCKTSTRKLAKYLTPKKNQATNTKQLESLTTSCQTDPLVPTGSNVSPKRDGTEEKIQPWQEYSCNTSLSGTPRHPKPKTYLYSSINPNTTFDSVDVLLETSRRVVQTAKMLETPP